MLLGTIGLVPPSVTGVNPLAVSSAASNYCRGCLHLQVQLLDNVKDVPHVIQLAASGTCMYLNHKWNVAVVKPYVRPLTPSDTLQVVGQVRSSPALLAPSPALQTHAHASQDTQRRLLLLDSVDMPVRSRGFPL